MSNVNRKIRLFVLERDKYTCQNCKTVQDYEGRSYEVHHIIPRRQGGTNEPDNLITYCHKCHTKIEPKTRKRICIAISITVPKVLLKWIDSERGEVSRSRFIFRILEEALR